MKIKALAGILALMAGLSWGSMAYADTYVESERINGTTARFTLAQDGQPAVTMNLVRGTPVEIAPNQTVTLVSMSDHMTTVNLNGEILVFEHGSGPKYLELASRSIPKVVLGIGAVIGVAAIIGNNGSNAATHH